MTATVPITVTTTVEEMKRKDELHGSKPAHWVDGHGGEFKNPWPSFRKHEFGDFFSVSLDISISF